MKTFISILYFLFLVVVSGQAQWLSLDASFGSGHIKDVRGDEFVSNDFIYGSVDGIDTMYFRVMNQYNRITQRRLDELTSFELAARINLPINERWYLSTGLGIASTNFQYRNVSRITNLVGSTDTLIGTNYPEAAYLLVAGGDSGSSGVNYGIATNGMPCDSLISDPFRLFNEPVISENGPTTNSFFHLILPLDITYELVPDLVYIKAGAQFNFAIGREQSYLEIRRIGFEPEEGLHLCYDDYFSTEPDEVVSLLGFNVLARLRIEAEVKKGFKFIVGASSYINSITNPVALTQNRRTDIPYSYRPVSGHVGLGIDLFR